MHLIEILIVVAILLVLFGAAKLPQLGRGLGEGIREFKTAARQDGETDSENKS